MVAKHLTHSRLLGYGLIITAGLLSIAGSFSFLQTEKLLSGDEHVAAVYANALVLLANYDRTNADLPDLRENPLLSQSAQLKAEDMAKNSYFAHTSPTGVEPWVWFREAGYPYLHAGENLAIRFVDTFKVHRAWMDSPDHRDNIMGAQYQEIGIGMATGLYQGRETLFIVQHFGTTRPGLTTPEAEVFSSEASLERALGASAFQAHEGVTALALLSYAYVASNPFLLLFGSMILGVLILALVGVGLHLRRRQLATKEGLSPVHQAHRTILYTLLAVAILMLVALLSYYYLAQTYGAEIAKL